METENIYMHADFKSLLKKNTSRHHSDEFIDRVLMSEHLSKHFVETVKALYYNRYFGTINNRTYTNYILLL